MIAASGSMILGLNFALRRDPVASWAIGHRAPQQSAAYNMAVGVLNREPELPAREQRHPASRAVVLPSLGLAGL